MTSDWDYFNRAHDGDEIAWNILFNRYYKFLLKICLLITGSVDTAKDLTQETFIRMMKVKLKHRDGNFKSYISTIAYRMALKEQKRTDRTSSTENLQIPAGTITPLDSIIKDERDKYIFNIIISLPKEQKDIMILRLYGAQSYTDIAHLMKIPVGTVKSRIFYAVKQCRKILIEKGIIE